MSGAVQSSCFLTDRACYINKSFLVFWLITHELLFSFVRGRPGSRSRSPPKGPSGFGIALDVVAEVPTELEVGSKYSSWQKGRDPRSSRGSTVGVEGAPR